MPFRPTKILKFIMSGTSESAWWPEDDGWQGYAYRWTTTLSITAQAHGSQYTSTPYYYDGSDVRVGDCIVTAGQGRILKIVNISVQTGGSVSCTVEDYDRENIMLDDTQSGVGGIPDGEGLLFEVFDGYPIIHPIPDALAGSLPPYFSADIISRFANKSNYIRILQTSHTFSVNDQIYLNPNTGTYALASPSNPAVIGVVSTVGTPGVNYFTYRPNGRHITNISPSLPGVPGDMLYLSASGGWTVTRPGDNAIVRMIKITNTEGMELSNISPDFRSNIKAGVVPVGNKDGSNFSFSLPNSWAYVPGTLSVYLNGMQYDPANINQVGPAYTSFTIVGDTLPVATDSFVVSFVL